MKIIIKNSLKNKNNQSIFWAIQMFQINNKINKINNKINNKIKIGFHNQSNKHKINSLKLVIRFQIYMEIIIQIFNKINLHNKLINTLYFHQFKDNKVNPNNNNQHFSNNNSQQFKDNKIIILNNQIINLIPSNNISNLNSNITISNLSKVCNYKYKFKIRVNFNNHNL